jgi:outer membrane protein assembly factor BamB
MHKLLCLTVAVLLAATVSAQDWNQWRGPARTGATAAFRAPATWPERPKRIWKVPAGVGHSSPIVAAGRVFLFSRIAEQEVITAYDVATGKQIWRQGYDAPYKMNPAAAGHGEGPKSTPVFDQGRLFTFGISGILSAWDAKDGAVLWRKDFRKDFPSTSPEYGVAMSPVVASGRLIVHVGGAGKGAILALDPARGGVLWSWKGDGPAYSSPIVADIGRTEHAITQSQSHVVGLSLADGRLLWRIPFTTSYDQNSVTPIVLDDLVIVSGLAKPLAALRVVLEDGKWVLAKVWQNDALPLYMSSPIVFDNHLYGLSQRNRGQFFCVDGRTGKTLWTTRGREGENAAMILAGNLLLATTTEGELIVARATPAAFEVIKRYTIAESPVWAHPAVVFNGVLIKDAESLAYWTFD